MFYWEAPHHRPAEVPVPAAPGQLPPGGTLLTEVYAEGCEPGFWIWDGSRWHGAVLLARHWAPGSPEYVLLRVHAGGHRGRRLFPSGQPGLLPAHPGPRVLPGSTSSTSGARARRRR